MSQISPPIRIVIVAAIGLLAAWMLFLRPKPEVFADPTPVPSTQTAPGVKGLTTAVDKAKGAAQTQAESDAKVQKAAGETGAAAGPGTGTAQGATGTAKATSTVEAALATGRVLTLAPLPDKALDGLPAGIRRALASREVFALGIFGTRNKSWAPMAADDRSVRRALKKANRYDRTVTIATTSLGGLSRLKAVVDELDVTQSPSVVVVDRNRQATVMTGFVDRVTINQAIADARRNSTAFRIKNDYLSELNQVCGQYGMRLERFALPLSPSGAKSAFRRLSRLGASYRTRFARLTPPARFKGLHAQLMTGLRGDMKAVGRAGAAVSAGKPALAVQIMASVDPAAGLALDRRMDRAGVTGCVGNRRT